MQSDVKYDFDQIFYSTRIPLITVTLETIPMPTSPTKKEPGAILSGCNIHIVDFNIPSRRLQVLKKVIAKNGGSYVEREGIDSDTIILADFSSVDAIKSAFSRSRARRVEEYNDEQYKRM